MYHGDIHLGDTLDIKFVTTSGATGAPTQLAGSPVISAYVGNSVTQITAGITLSVDFDGVTGLNNVRVVASGGNGFGAATNVQLVITTGTVGGTSAVGYVVASFSIDCRGVNQWNGTAVSAPATAGIPDVNVKNINNAAAATPGAAGGLFIAGTNAATTVTTSFTTTFTGSLTGSVASVSGAVGSVAGAVGSVAGSVGSVTAPVSVTGDFTATMKTSLGTAVAASAVASVTGNVGGSVASVTAGVTLAAGAIDAASLATAGKNAIADSFLDRADAVEVGLTPRQQMRVVGAAAGGKASGLATTTAVYRNAVADSKDRIVATVDASGNRTAITYDLTT